MEESKTPLLSVLTLTVFNDGSCSRAPYDPPPVPASPSPLADEPDQVLTKDLTLNSSHRTSARLFLPFSPPHSISDATTEENEKQRLPILLYFHGGGFVYFSTAVPVYHNFLCRLARDARILIVSVDYRLAPEHRLPCAFEDGMEALQWLRQQQGETAEPWLASHGDLSKVLVGGDSAGAVLAYHVALRAAASESGLGLGLGLDPGLHRAGPGLGSGLDHGLHLSGLVLTHPSFIGEDMTDSEARKREACEYLKKIWRCCLPEGSSLDHPYANPLLSSSAMAEAALPPALVVVASEDLSLDRAVAFSRSLQNAGIQARLFVSHGEDHGFYLFNPASENFNAFLNHISEFINQLTCN